VESDRTAFHNIKNSQKPRLRGNPFRIFKHAVKMGWHKPHLKVDEHKLYSEDANKEVFTLHRHSAAELTRILVQNSKRRGNNLSPRQKKAFAAFFNSELLDIRKDTEHSRHEVVEAYFHFFDDLFFFGSLRHRVELRIADRTSGGVVGLAGGTRGLYKDDQILGMFDGRLKKAAVLSLFLRQEESRSRKQALQEYRGTLLHEMIHAFLICWACDYEECRVAWSGHGAICKKLFAMNLVLILLSTMAFEPFLQNILKWVFADSQLSRARYCLCPWTGFTRGRILTVGDPASKRVRAGDGRA
jgi:hypothetical protein